MRTKLDIINEGLSAIGLAAIGSLDSQHPAFLRALSTFNRINERIQLRGWWFNRYKKTFTPNTQNEIILPQYAATVRVDDNNDLIVRNGKLFNRDTREYKVYDTVSCTVIELLPIEDVPPVAADYITQAYVYKYYLDEDGMPPKLGEYKDAMTLNWYMMQAEELKHEDVNFFTGAAAATKLGYSSRKEGLY